MANTSKRHSRASHSPTAALANALNRAIVGRLIAAFGAAALAVGLSACAPAAGSPDTGTASSAAADSGAADASAEAAASMAVGPDTVVLDVRTPEEFAGGHLEGAELLDFSSGDFEAALPSLDPTTEYVVYCRSGNRSGQAIALMEAAGFTNLTNLGSLEQAAAATGLAVQQ